MKFFSFFALLNLLVLFAYAQDQAPPGTCEEAFSLKGTTCTPCQQTLLNTIRLQPP